MTICILGIDIAKNTFQLHGADISGSTALKRRLPRRNLATYVANLPTCTIVMESCGGANYYWARVFQGIGHLAKLISPQFVKPFVKTNKNDANDTQAIVETASRRRCTLCRSNKLSSRTSNQPTEYELESPRIEQH